MVKIKIVIASTLPLSGPTTTTRTSQDARISAFPSSLGIAKPRGNVE